MLLREDLLCLGGRKPLARSVARQARRSRQPALTVNSIDLALMIVVGGVIARVSNNPVRRITMSFLLGWEIAG